MSEEFYIGLNLFSVFLASCTQVVLKKSAMNDRLTGLAYFVNPATIAAYSVFLGCCLLTFYCLSHLPMITVNMLECSAYVYILLFDRIFWKTNHHAQSGRQRDDYRGHYRLPEPLRKSLQPFSPSGLFIRIGS